MCQSGRRSPYAASDLHEAGYQKVCFQVEGFEGLKVKQGPNKGKRVLNGWKNSGLPWGYALKTEKMYFILHQKTEYIITYDQDVF
jgi:rhodanese-related sulfurtransferase